MSLAELRYHVGLAVDRFYFRVRFRGRELVDGTINRGQLRYAQDLVLQMARKHYCRLSEPGDHFAPFDDIAGCLTQIDNMLTGMQRQARCPVCGGHGGLRPTEAARFRPVHIDLLIAERNGEFDPRDELECHECKGRGEVVTVQGWDHKPL